MDYLFKVFLVLVIGVFIYTGIKGCVLDNKEGFKKSAKSLINKI
jgi:hypothetical protein